ncbi:hypothetical protein BAE44_0005950 [Dichanthelium oligosanthes]|uniref:25S rRNA (uridine-N(3))-methyltransferase BMT5-like domain-containing protein n=1 Tax=Dichanthelium oligosanthes TaxID=888268 RepID=A0A1E5W6M3_9POAL|nr:hypothetical protein BAE44_0005950 [Dichanthelium oligosanthes]
MAGASPEDALAAAAAGGNREGAPPPAGVTADGRWQGDQAEGVAVMDLTVEEEKEGAGARRAEGVPVIDLTVAGEGEGEGRGVGGPRAESVPVIIDLTEEGSDEEGEQEEEVMWVGQYSSTQSILLVGDGDFSFSLALAAGFGSGANLVATSLDCYGLFSFLI